MAHPPVTETKPSQPLTLHGLTWTGVDRCVHCGLCLAYCPTFSELGTEMDSPRGRIMLIKSLAEGRINLTDSTVAHLDLCLGCRACETVCPSGVPYGQLIEAARAEIERQRPGGLLRRRLPLGQLLAAAAQPVAAARWPPPGSASTRPAGCGGWCAPPGCCGSCPSRCATGSRCCRTCRPAPTARRWPR